MRTDEEQQEMIAQKNAEWIEFFEKANEENEEYHTRVFHWKVDFTGKLHVPTSSGFHPNHFVGTQAEYDKIWTYHLQGREDEFKIIGEHKFDSSEELEKVYSIKKYKKND